MIEDIRPARLGDLKQPHPTAPGSRHCELCVVGAELEKARPKRQVLPTEPTGAVQRQYMDVAIDGGEQYGVSKAIELQPPDWRRHTVRRHRGPTCRLVHRYSTVDATDRKS